MKSFTNHWFKILRRRRWRISEEREGFLASVSRSRKLRIDVSFFAVNKILNTGYDYPLEVWESIDDSLVRKE